MEKNERKSVWEICAREREIHHSIDGYNELHNKNPQIYKEANDRLEAKQKDKVYIGKKI